MRHAPQEVRTFFVSSATFQRRSIFQSHPLCDLLLDVLRQNRAKQRMQIHEFVFMPDHIHLILTPAPNVPLEKAVQFIKGGFSFRAKKEMNAQGEIWQAGFDLRLINDADSLATHVEYIRTNPVRVGLVERPEDFPYSSARLREEVDPPPPALCKASAATR